MMDALRQVDPEVYEAVTGEARRQHFGLELIASENFVSEAVLETMGSVMTNKYAEGYPGRRYYGGCVNMDSVEDLARDAGGLESSQLGTKHPPACVFHPLAQCDQPQEELARRLLAVFV